MILSIPTVESSSSEDRRTGELFIRTRLRSQNMPTHARWGECGDATTRKRKRRRINVMQEKGSKILKNAKKGATTDQPEHH